MWCLIFFLFSIFLILPIKNTKSQARDVDSHIFVTILDVPPETLPTLVAEVTLAALVAHRVEGLVQLEPRLSVKSPMTLIYYGTLITKRIREMKRSYTRQI